MGALALISWKGRGHVCVCMRGLCLWWEKGQSVEPGRTPDGDQDQDLRSGDMGDVITFFFNLRFFFFKLLGRHARQSFMCRCCVSQCCVGVCVGLSLEGDAWR